MNDFIILYPEIISWFMASLLTLVMALGAAVLYFGKKAFAGLITAIDELKVAIITDRTDIGGLKDRMQEQETICKMQRQYCPLNNQVLIHQKGTVGS